MKARAGPISSSLLRAREQETFMGFPVVSDPALGANQVMIEHRLDGGTERVYFDISGMCPVEHYRVWEHD